jgi:hypothetical protein
VHKFHTFEHCLGSHPRPGEQGKNQKIRRKRATVARYSMLYRFLCNAMQRARGKSKKYGANAPQLHHISCAPADFAINHPAGLAESGVGGSAVVAS